jgi:hypothetical protein
MHRLLVLVGVGAAGCTSLDDGPVEIGGWLAKADVHVDTAQPTALVAPDIVLSLYGGDIGRHVRIDVIYAAPAVDNPSQQLVTLPFGFGAAEALFVPGGVYMEVPLVNASMQNRELAAYCQQHVPMTIYVGLPGAPERWFSVTDMLTVFCP